MNFRRNGIELSVRFKPGDRIIYIPDHAKNDRAHPSCQKGIVKSVVVDAETHVWCVFANGCWNWEKGVEQNYTAARCRPDQLVLKEDYD